MNRNALFYLHTGSLILLIIVIIGYSFYQARTIIFGPSITLTSPLDGQTYMQPLIDISGVAKNTNYLTLDDRPIFTDKKGNFDEKLLLAPGYNVIKLDAGDKFGKKTEKIIQVILQAQPDDINVKNQVVNPLSTSTIEKATTTNH